jgi:hypothetical protein
MACSVQGQTEKGETVKGKVKIMLIIFVEIKKIVQKEFVLEDQTVNSKY